ncbi:hypothetical protein CRENBAI_021571, partial [Crenichthys baileyi]
NRVYFQRWRETGGCDPTQQQLRLKSSNVTGTPLSVDHQRSNVSNGGWQTCFNTGFIETVQQ